MSVELISLHILTVFRSSADGDLLRRGGGLAAVPAEIVHAPSAASAEQLLGPRSIDLVLLDAGLPAEEKARICKAARGAKQRPFVIAVGTGSDGADVDATVAKPANIDEARSLIEGCIRTRVPARVLVVDDSATMRSIVRKILSASKFPLEISEADEGSKALQQLREGSFDIVLLDYNMPGLNGFETLTELRREHPMIAVVIMTSTDNEAFAERARKAGAAFLKKPFFPSDIDAVLYGIYRLAMPRKA